MDAKVPACLKNNSQKGYILKRITVSAVLKMKLLHLVFQSTIEDIL